MSSRRLARPHRPAAALAKARLRIEPLEDRTVLSHITNVLVNNPAADLTAQDTQSETSIVLAGSNIVAAFNDSGSYGSGSSHFTGWGYSTNGGTSFTDGGKLPTSTNGDAGDPVLAYHAASGTLYLSTLSLNTGNAIQFFKSTNGGVSWSAPVNSAPGYSSRQTLDKEWITVDNFAGSGNGNIYQVLTDFQGSRDKGIFFNRSTDGGTTWSSGLSLGGHQGGNVVVGPDHSVYVFYWHANTFSEDIDVRKSTNQGATFASAVTITGLATTGSNGDLGLGFRSNAFPQAAVNPVNGNLYVVFNDKGTGGDRANVYFTQSTNGGSSWSTPVRLNDDATTRDQWQPVIAVTPDGSRVGVFWYDRRSDPANSLIERWGVIGSISGSTVTWGANGHVSDASWPAAYGQDPVVNSTYMGDYDTATADNSYFYLTWGDNRLGNAFHANQPDVRFAKVAVSGVLGPVGTAGTISDQGPTSHRASDFPPGYMGGVYLTKFNDEGFIAVGQEQRGRSASSPAQQSPVQQNRPDQTTIDQFMAQYWAEAAQNA